MHCSKIRAAWIQPLKSIIPETSPIYTTFNDGKSIASAKSGRIHEAGIRKIISPQSLHRQNTYFGNYSAHSGRDNRISLRDGTEPFDCEVLNAEEQITQLLTFDFYFVRGECETERFLSFGGADELRGDKVTVWKKVHLFAGKLDTEAGGCGFALPADKGGGRFGVCAFHGEIVFRGF